MEAVQPLDLTTSGAAELRPFIANPVIDRILGIEYPLETVRAEAKAAASSSNASHIAQQQARIGLASASGASLE